MIRLFLLLALAADWQRGALAMRETQAALASYADAREVALHCHCAPGAIELGDDLASAARLEPSRDTARFLYAVVAHIATAALRAAESGA